jgi:diaminohydroxyphosphoribosylaminopyrimidine deaminase/5-amino-6-(5-phosphoribosylamino)uracil reductase
MQLCIAKALEYKGKTKTNPTVGAAVVKNGEIVAIDAHRAFGEGHAEFNVLKKVGEFAKGADLYVTLEPCATYGKTPPCINAILEAGIKRVFIGVIDPNPLNSGKGFNALRKHKVETYVGFQKEACAELIEDFTKITLKKRTYNILKVGQSLDGKIATKKRDSYWITSNSSREYVHFLRSTCDGILVGINTVLIDNPLLNVRLEGFEERGLKKIVLDTILKIDEECELIKRYSEDLIIFTGNSIDKKKKERLLSKGVQISECGINERGLINLEEVVVKLLDYSIVRVLVEGGATVHGSFLDYDDIDYVYFFTAPLIIGGKSAVTSIGGEGVEFVREAHRLKKVQYQQFEEDLLIQGKLKDYSGYVLEQTEKISKLCLQE